MASQEFVGNVTPAPAFSGVGPNSDDQEILYSTARFTQKGVTLKPGQGILPAGTVLGRVTATKLWAVYNNGASDGTEVARGVLRAKVNTGTDAAGDRLLANIVISGILKNDMVSGADSNALVDLGATVDTVLNTFKF